MADFESRHISKIVEIVPGWIVRACGCGRCGHRWISKTPAEPATCPNVNCGSEYWNRPVKNLGLQAAQLKRWKKRREG